MKTVGALVLAILVVAVALGWLVYGVEREMKNWRDEDAAVVK